MKNSEIVESKECGFALIIALGVMSLVVLLTLAMSSMAKVHIEQASTMGDIRKAELNALLSLRMAIGEVKKNLEADQRVSANGELMSSKEHQKHWVGVWDSNPNSSDYSKQLNWLVSNPNDLNETAVPLVGVRSNNDKVLVNSTILVNEEKNKNGEYAWWISDEGQKAKLNFEHLDEYTKSDRAQRSVVPGNSGVAQILNRQIDGDTVTSLGKVSSRAQYDIVFKEYPDFQQNSFHNYSASSMGVLTNVKDGGLKKNLSAAFSHSSEFDKLIAYAGKTKNGDSLFDQSNQGNDILDDPGGPLWKQMQSFYQQGQNVSGSFPNDSISLVLSNNETSGVAPVTTQVHLFNYAAYLDAGGGKYEVIWFFMPGIVIWNPYNIQMDIPDLYFRVFEQGETNAWNNGKDGQLPMQMGYSVENAAPAIGTYIGTAVKTNNVLKRTFRWDVHKKGPGKVPGLDWRDPLQFKIPATSIAPGQALAFSPDSNQPITGDADTNVLAQGFNPDFAFYYRTGVTFTQTGSHKMNIGGNHCFRFVYELNTSKNFTNNTVVHKLDRGSAYGMAGNWDNNQYFFIDYQPPYFSSVQANTPIPLWGTGTISNYPAFGFKQSMKFASSGYGDIFEKEKRVQWITQHNPRAPFNSESPMVEGAYVSDKNRRGLKGHASYHGGFTVLDTWYNIEDNYNGDGAAVGSSDMLGDGQPRCVLYPAVRPETPLNSLTSLTYTNFSKNFNFDNFPSFGEHRFLNGNLKPSYPIGNSYPDARIRNDLTQQAWASLSQIDIGKSKMTSYHYDYSYLMNEAIYDQYFMASLKYSDRDLKGEVNFPLPNTRMVGADKNVDYNTLHTFDDAAKNLMVDGAFNVNSLSVEAWKSLLNNSFGEKVQAVSGLKGVGDSSSFNRFQYPLNGGVSDGISDEGLNSYTGFRTLSLDEVNTLAKAIVDEIKLRRSKSGPYLSMADFVNREVNNSNETYRLRGLLQAAIDKSGINSKFDQQKYQTFDNQYNDDYPDKNWDGSVVAGVPGYLLQSDILSQLDSVLTVRSDTFTVRAYGSSVDPVSGKVISKKWCEAIVQRTPEELTGRTNERNFIIQNFRWLNEEDI